MVRWAPLNVPLDRRLQTLAVMFIYLAQPVALGLTVFLLWFGPLTRLLMLLYLGFILFETEVLKVHKRKGRASVWWKNLTFWKHYSEYYPARLYKETTLCGSGSSHDESDVKQKFVIGYHPHGIIGLGCFAHFLSNGSGSMETLKEIDAHMMVLNTIFYIPFSREIALLGGALSVSKDSIEYSLKQGRSCVIAVGGAKEALNAIPGTLTLTLKNRVGFVKIAIRNGAHLVPALSFGENEIFNQVPNEEGTLWRKIQNGMQKYMGFSLPIPYGRGVFNYDFGCLPYRRPINTFVGEPIYVKQDANPDDKTVFEYHSMYLANLQKLYDQHKDEYFPENERKSTLIFK